MPRYKSRKDRIHQALRLYHGIGTEDGEEWSVDEIADHLNVRQVKVKEYLFETPQAEEVSRTLDKVADQTRREIVMDKRDRLRQLRKLEEELREAVEVVVTDFEFQDVELEVSGHPGDGIDIAEDADATYRGDVPVPSEVKQVPHFRRLQAVWEEMREVEEDLSRLMGLNEPDEVDVRADVTEQKLYKLGDDEDAKEEFPEQEVQDLSEEDSV